MVEILHRETRNALCSIQRDRCEVGGPILWCNLDEAGLRQYRIQVADLRHLNLTGYRSLQDADLRFANLKNSNLHSMDLHGADLRGANLQGANLKNAQLDGANLEGAILEGVRYDEQTKWPKGFDVDSHCATMRHVLRAKPRTISVYGVTQGSRQRAVAAMRRNDEVTFALDKKKDGVEILDLEGNSLGWVPQEEVGGYLYFMKLGCKPYGRVQACVGGTDGKNFGLRLLVAWVPVPAFAPASQQIISVAGVTHGDRQQNVARLKRNDEVKFVREKRNQFDRNAIAVRSMDDAELGYVPRHLAEQYAPLIDGGQRLHGRVLNRVGGTDGKRLGLRLLVGWEPVPQVAAATASTWHDVDTDWRDYSDWDYETHGRDEDEEDRFIEDYMEDKPEDHTAEGLGTGEVGFEDADSEY